MKRKNGKILPVLSWLTILLALFTIFFWVSNPPFARGVNEFITGLSGLSLNYVLITTLFSVGCGLWGLLRIVGSAYKERFPGLLKGKIVFTFLAVFHAIFWIAEFAILFIKDPLQPVRMAQWMGFFSPILALPALIAIVALTLPMVARAYHLRREQSPYAFVFVALWIFLWSAALWNPPTSIYRDDLPAKPQLIAHRGASGLAPENTISSARLAAEMGRKGVILENGALVLGNGKNSPSSIGVETDIRISLDGTLFVLHDSTLQRTTDVESVYPDRQDENASQFTMAELELLNAGEWFLSLHPVSSLPVGIITTEFSSAYQLEKIPTLEEWLRIVKDEKMTFIFDLLPPPDGHPYSEQFFDLALQQISQADIADQVWFLVDEQTLMKAKAVSPGFHMAHSTDYTHPPSVTNLRLDGYEIVNSEYGLSSSWIKKYQQAGIHVNIWTVDEEWQFSRLWLLGVDSVTTNNLAEFAALQRPFLAIPYGWFALAWCAAGILLAVYAILRIWRWRSK